MARTLEEPPKTKGHILLDIGLGWLVLYEHSEHWLDFKAYEVTGLTDGKIPNYRTPKYQFTEDVALAEPSITGFVKWDGCAEYDLTDGHVCGLLSLQQLIAVMTELHRLCLLLPNIDKDLAGY